MGITYRYDGAAIAAVESRFREDLWRAAPKDAIEEAEIRLRRFGSVLATVFGELPKTALMNVVQGAAEPNAVEGGDLATAIEWVRSREVDYLVSVAQDRPGREAAEAWLGARGYVRAPTVRRFLHQGAKCSPVDARSLDVTELSPLETEGMSHIFGEALHLPSLATIPMMGLPTRQGWHCYRANLEGHEVACGSMLVLLNVALLALDATLPEARGRGCQTALITRRLADATREGCDVVVAEIYDSAPSSEVAIGNLQRLGFVEIPGVVTWRRPTGIA